MTEPRAERVVDLPNSADRTTVHTSGDDRPIDLYVYPNGGAALDVPVPYPDDDPRERFMDEADLRLLAGELLWAADRLARRGKDEAVGWPEDDMVQVVMGGTLLADFKTGLAMRGLRLFQIPWEKDGKLTLGPNPDDLPTYSVCTVGP